MELPGNNFKTATINEFINFQNMNIMRDKMEDKN